MFLISSRVFSWPRRALVCSFSAFVILCTDHRMITNPTMMLIVHSQFIAENVPLAPSAWITVLAGVDESLNVAYCLAGRSPALHEFGSKNSRDISFLPTTISFSFSRIGIGSWESLAANASKKKLKVCYLSAEFHQNSSHYWRQCDFRTMQHRRV